MRRYRRKPDNRDDGKIFRRAYIYYLTASYTCSHFTYAANALMSALVRYPAFRADLFRLS